MKNTTRRKSVQFLSAAMAMFLIASFLMISLTDNGSGSRVQASVTASGLTDVTDQMDLHDLQSEYYNPDTVQRNEFGKDEDCWVIVDFDEDSLMDDYLDGQFGSDFATYSETVVARDKADRLSREHDVFLSQLSAKGIPYEYKYSYTALNNGMAIKIKNSDINAVRKMNGVTDVYYSESYAEPQVAVSNNANVYTTGIYNSKNLKYKGDGMVVAILDTGLDFSHNAFSTMPDGSDIWTKSHVADKFSETLAKKERAVTTTPEQVYYNAKIPFAFDYADNDPDVYPSHSTHGTHVAGIVAGQDDGKVVNPETGETFIGVAPRAQLAICKVFTDNPDSKMLGGADTIDILAALNDCVTMGVDVINMSLGSSAGFSTERGDRYVAETYSKVEEAGISLIVAASNDFSSGYGGPNGTNLASNPDSGTVGSPSTYSAALSVASINGQEARYMIVNQDKTGDENVAFITDASDGNGNDYDFMKQLYEQTKTPLDQPLTMNFVMIGGVGRPTNYTAAVKRELAKGNTIAVVRRGDITFAEKVQNAMNNGAAACIIYNNLSGTIRMSLGEVENPIPTCSIGMDEGKMMEQLSKSNRGRGTVTFSPQFTAGPFMSDFSSWGPTPELLLKPEITAHGGEITSCVPGGYDEYSGTSMAAPNMAGAVALLRQHVRETEHLTGKALNARINQLLMSTATMALNQEGNPYSPRKQGAGLADINAAIETEGYITVTGENGAVRDKTKLELGDDKNRTGVYKMSFTVNNFSDHDTQYTPKAYVMTETLATDLKTVAEKAHMLNDSTVTVKNGNTVIKEGSSFTVKAGKTVTLDVEIRLSKAAKKYLDDSFKNGMYIEGFIRLDSADPTTTKVALGIPFLAFYGDWTDAPLFDYSVYELAASQQDSSVDEEHKLKASSADTKILGLYFDDQYILPLGSYLYKMSDFDTEIYPSQEKAAISKFDMMYRRTIYELYMVYAGLLRGASEMDIVVTDTATGDVVLSRVDQNVRKAYAAGGSNRGTPIMMEIDPYKWGMNNNSTYKVDLRGKLAYAGGDNPDRKDFSFMFTIDYEAPSVLDYRIRYEAYTENKVVKYRIFMDVDVFDNQFVQDVMPCYVNEDRELTLITQYPIPVYSQKGEQSTVSFEITNIYEDFVKTGQLYIAVEDYAMNQKVYQVNVSEAQQYPDSVDLQTDNKLMLEGVEENDNEAKSEYTVYSLTLQPNESYRVVMSALPDTTVGESLIWNVSNSRVKVKGNEIFAASVGNSEIVLTDGDVIKAKINVTIAGKPLREPVPERISFKPIFNNFDYLVDPTIGTVELNPNQKFRLEPIIEPWYCSKLTYLWESSNPAIASVDRIGNVVTHKKGTAYITMRIEGNDLLSKSVKLKVGDDFRIQSFTLYDYYGGPEVVIPNDKNIMFMDEKAFQNNTEITSVVLPKTLMEIPKNAFKGCVNLKSVFIPSECTIVNENAFEGCKNLEIVKLGEFVDKNTGDRDIGAITIGKNAFKGCTSLKTIENPMRLTTAYDHAFSGCTSLQTLDLRGLRITGSYVFENCTSLTEVITNENTAIGNYMFFGCSNLKSFEFKGSRLNDGAFMGCVSLSEFRFNTPALYYIGKSALASTAIQTLNLPNGAMEIGENAFGNCFALQSVHLSANTVLYKNSATPFIGCSNLKEFTADANSAAYSSEGGVLYNKDKTIIEAVPYAVKDYVLPATVTAIADAAFAGRTQMKSIDLSNIKQIGAYAFANTGLEEVVLPESITDLAPGVFYGCNNLTKVNLDNIQSVGDFAFLGCAQFKNVNLPLAVSVGVGAFRQSGVETISADNLKTIGANAFSESALKAASFAKATSVGEYAFANCPFLISAELGGVTEMGTHVFYITESLKQVKFAEGTTAIGAYAFYTDKPATVLTDVQIPGSVTLIGEYAFFNEAGIISLNLASVQNIGDFAFYECTKLENPDLSNVEIVGKGAFIGAAALKEATLTSAHTIGDGAFTESGLTSVKFPSLKKIGKYAFTDTKLKTVTIPTTFNDVYFKDEWKEIGDNGKPKDVLGKLSKCFGVGAFSGIPTLTEIRVADGNASYRSIDGVLYSVTKDGLYLEQYPAGKADETYAIVENTIRLGDSSFEGAVNLKAVSLPYTVRNIGSCAFYQSSVKDYTFASVVAPVLETTYVDDLLTDEELLIEIFGYVRDAEGARPGLISSTTYYANFLDYVAKITEKDALSLGYEVPDFGLTLHCPKNGKGYDTVIWNSFFSTKELSEEICPENITREAMDLIAAIPAAEEVKAILQSGTKDEQIAAVRAISAEQVQKARLAYNKIQSEEQRALVTEYQKLLDTELAIREVKEQLGIPAALTDLVMAHRPNKIKYIAGETFDASGMVIKALYDDQSEIIVTDYEISKSVLSEEDRELTISFGGKTCTVKIQVEADPNAPVDPDVPVDPDDPVDPDFPVDPDVPDVPVDPDAEDTGCGGCGGCVGTVTTVLGGTALLGATAIVWNRKSKKNSATKNSDKE